MRFLFFILALAPAIAQQPAPAGAIKEAHVNDATANIIESSHDARQLLQAALDLARSDREQDHANLARWLTTPGFLSRLDSAQEYASTGRRLRISMVLQALSANAAPSAPAVLVTLAHNQAFLAEAPRVDFLIQYSSAVRPAPEELVHFWDAHCQPEDGFANLTVATLVTNGTEPAMRLLERKLADSRFEHEDKLSWIQTDIYAHRIEMPVLLFCEREMAGRTLSNDLKSSLAEVLFDPKPQRWFRPATIIVPPPLDQASAEAKAVFHRIGAVVVQAPWAGEELRKATQRTLASLAK